jgi:hypothetical protein
MKRKNLKFALSGFAFRDGGLRHTDEILRIRRSILMKLFAVLSRSCQTSGRSTAMEPLFPPHRPNHNARYANSQNPEQTQDAKKTNPPQGQAQSDAAQIESKKKAATAKV